MAKDCLERELDCITDWQETQIRMKDLKSSDHSDTHNRMAANSKSVHIKAGSSFVNIGTVKKQVAPLDLRQSSCKCVFDQRTRFFK